jgi:predicted HicB family RNase H-like nuclease
MTKNTLKYKGYTGNVHFDAEDRVFHGRVLGITDVIGFEGASVSELENDFHEAIDDYLETCREIGKEPEKPFSGRFVLRIPSELHCAISLEAKRQNKSINQWIAETCRQEVSDSIRQ